jgi:hypothetical protein
MTTSITEALQQFFAEAKHPVLFTGAGVSVRAGLPTWRKLIEQLAEGLRGSHPLMTQIMYECINDGDYTKAIDHFNLSQKMLEGDKQNLLQSIFRNYDANAILPVAQLPVQCCLTTNFDRSILDAFAKSRQQAPRDYKYGDSSFKQAQWEEQFFVARIHGAIEIPTSIVLSESQFNAVLKDDVYADFLGACFTQKNVLFLGFSFYDPAIRNVFEELDRRFGAASAGRHLALLPSDLTSDFLRKADRLNIKVLQYSPDDNHAELWEGINSHVSNTKGTGAKEPQHSDAPFDVTKRYLAACYARAKSHGTSVALKESVTEGIVSAIIQEAAPTTVTRKILLDKVRLALGIQGKEVESIIDNALRALLDAGLCRRLKSEGGRGFDLAWIGEPEKSNSLDAAIELLADSVAKRAYLQEGWKTGQEVKDTITSFFQHLVRRRGWDLGAAFAARRAPDVVSVNALLRYCAVGLAAFDLERLARVCESALQQPSEEESAVLNELGRVSFALEMAFQSPRSVLLHEAVLPRVIYFDASVLLPALVTGHPFCKVYSDAIYQLKKASSKAAINLKLKVCSAYLNEIISHRNNALGYCAQFPTDFHVVAKSDALFHGTANVNVFIGAYANWNETNAPISFDQFLSRVAPYSTEQQLKVWLTEQGFDVFQATKSQRYSDFYSILEMSYASSLTNGKGPILIEHDAIQLSHLEFDLAKGEKSLFVTADRKLQHAVSLSKHAAVGELMISHIGLIQFIELLLGGMEDGASKTQLLWSSCVSDRTHAIRSYFTSLALQEYDAGMLLTMPAIIDSFADNANKELERLSANLDADDPRSRANAFRILGMLEKNYISGMHDAAERLQASIK